MARQRGRCSRQSKAHITPGPSTAVEYDMCHVLLDKDAVAGMDGRRAQAIVEDVRRGLCPEMTEAELQLVDMVHPRQVDDRGSRVEYYQQVETCP